MLSLINSSVIGFEGIVVEQRFDPVENWLAPLFTGDGAVSEHSFKEKALADVVEALIGCFLHCCTEKMALKVMNQYFEIPVLPDSGEVCDFEVICPALSSSLNGVDMSSTDTLFAGFDTVEATLNYKFQNKMFLLQALTHASYVKNDVTDNYQRLEFLGDALIDLLITRHIFEEYPDLDPGSLTDLRSALVNNVLFASLAVKLGLNKSLKHMSPLLHRQITDFVCLVTTSQVRSVREQRVVHKDISSTSLQNGNTNKVRLLTFSELENESDVDDPKPLGDVVEAVVAAIYLDSGLDESAVWSVFFPFLADLIKKLYSRQLRERLQTRFFVQVCR